MNRRIALLASAFIVATHLSAFAVDAVWPTKPIRIIVPGGPGGVPDIRARWLAERLLPALGQSVFVENKVGAGGNIGTEMGARSAPDGYTLTIVHQGTMTINPHLYSRLGYDPLVDFAPITHLGIGPLLLAVSPNVPVTTVAELVRSEERRVGKEC